MSLGSPKRRSVCAAASLTLLLWSGACAGSGAMLRTGPTDPGERVPGLYPCAEGRPDAVHIDPHRPLTLFVHGCTSSGARFRTLAQVFEAHDQQTLCFNYNDRSFLNTSATQLAKALSAIQRRLSPQQITIVGHSQGGLVARRALQSDLPRPLVMRPGFSYRLVTVSSPFRGIESSADCTKVWLHVVTLSGTIAACMVIAGNKWTEIPPGSRFMTNPALLIPQVIEHLHVVTDERGSCRGYDADGECEASDFVFSLEEQYSDLVSADKRVTSAEIDIGHAAAVGENRVPPHALIAVLQQHHVLAPTPPARQDEVVALLNRLYR